MAQRTPRLEGRAIPGIGLKQEAESGGEKRIIIFFFLEGE